MTVRLIIFVSALGSVGLGRMAWRAWGWTERPKITVFGEGSYAAALPASLMMGTTAVGFVPLAFSDSTSPPLWASIQAGLILAAILVFGVLMYAAFTYRRPRRLIPPALRWP
jgi:hypothetical protein